MDEPNESWAVRDEEEAAAILGVSVDELVSLTVAKRIPNVEWDYKPPFAIQRPTWNRDVLHLWHPNKSKKDLLAQVNHLQYMRRALAWGTQTQESGENRPIESESQIAADAEKAGQIEEFVQKETRTVSNSDRFQILKRDSYKCQLCGATAQEGARLEVDHKVAFSKGGSTDMANLWTLCYGCNRGKAAQDL